MVYFPFVMIVCASCYFVKQIEEKTERWTFDTTMFALLYVGGFALEFVLYFMGYRVN